MTTKSIFRICGIYLLMVAVFACASGSGSSGASTASAGSAVDVEKKVVSTAKAEELSQDKADIAVFPQVGNRGNVNSVAFSPDGMQIISCSLSTIKLWDAVTAREIRTFTGHSKQVESVAFSPNGCQILSGSLDNTMKLWDVVTGNEIKTFSEHSAGVWAVTFSPDGKQVLSGSSDRTMKLWDVDTGNEIRTFSAHSYGIMSVAFSPDGKQVISGSVDHTIKLWDVVTGNEIRTFSGHTYTIDSVVFSPDGKMIMSGSDNTIKLWDKATGNVIRTFTHSGGVLSVAFSPDGKQAVSGGGDIKLWNLETGKIIRTISGHTYAIYSVIFSPDGKLILAGSSDFVSPDSSLKMWDSATGREIRTFTGNAATPGCIAFNFDGKRFISGYHDGTIKLWDTTTGKEIKTFSGHSSSVDSIAFSPDGKLIISGSYDETVKLWDTNTGNEIKTFKHTHHVNSVAFSPDGNLILAGNFFGSAKLWDITTGKEIKGMFGAYVSFSPNGRQIIIASKNSLILEDIASGKIRIMIDEDIRAVAFSPDGRYILSGSYLGTVRLWDAATCKEIKTYKHGGHVQSVTFSPDGNKILSGSEHQDADLSTIKLWEIATNVETIKITGHSGGVKSVAFSPDGKQILSAGSDRTVRLWDVSSGKEIAQFVSFSGSDSQLASASRGLTVEIQTATTSNNGEWLSITPDGYYNASPRGDRYINVRVNSTVSGIDAYRSVLYNPDVVQARLQGKPDPKSKANVTIQQAASFIPPTVIIQSPIDLSTTNTATENLSVAITSQSQPIKNIKIIVNGRLIGKDELAEVKGTGLQPERASFTVTGNQKTVNFSLPLNLDPGPNRIEVVAFNGYSESRRYVDVTRNAPAGEKPSLPNLWILAVGVNAYDNAGTRLQGLGNLNFCVADAKGLVDSMKTQEGKRYAKVNSLLIADGEAQTPTAANIKQGLKFLEGAAPRDVVVLFLAGHGISAQESKFFFLPKDAAFSGNKVVDASRAISGDEIMSVLDAPGNRLVFIDACQSGGVDNDRMVRSLMDTNAFVFAASRGNELSYEDPKLGHGYFTHSVMSALKGAPAALAQGSVSVLSMSGFVQIDVPRLTGDRQHPSAYSLGFYDFPMALIK